MASVQLIIPSAEEVAGKPGVALLQAASPLAWKPPGVLCDLSAEAVAPDLFLSGLTAHATFAGTFERQFLFGFHHLHALVSPDGEFNCQEIRNYRGRLEFHVSHPPPASYAIPEIRKTAGDFTVGFERLAAGEVEQLPGFTFFGTPIEPENWGMWLLNGLLSAFSYVAAGQPGRYLCYAAQPWQRQLLNFMGVAPERIVPQKPWTTYFCEQVTLHQYSHIDLVPDMVSKAIFSNIVGRCKAKPMDAPAGEKIFISRRSITRKLGGRYRCLLNEDELAEAFQASGYTIVEPELLPFEQQVLVFDRARVVVGLGGAAMFNTVFCKPGTKIVSIESNGAFALNHARLFAAAGHEYGFVFGQQNTADNNYPHNTWQVDVTRTLRAVQSFV